MIISGEEDAVEYPFTCQCGGEMIPHPGYAEYWCTRCDAIMTCDDMMWAMVGEDDNDE